MYGNSSNLEETRQEWTEEQVAIAKQVVLSTDDWTERVVSESERHRLVSLPSIKDNETKHQPQYYGGVDVSFPAHESDPSVAVYVVVDAVTMKVVYQDSEYFHLTMLYIPSFLAFREIDPIVRLVEKQRQVAPAVTPTAILVDGNGILHPRRAGIACFVGVRTGGIPTIGIGKTLYCEGGLTHSTVERGVEQALHAARNALPTLAANGGESNEHILFDKHAIGKPQQEEMIEKDDTDDTDSRACVQAMEPYCGGLAVPLDVRQDKSDDNECILACALVGHGGRVKGRRQQRHERGGTKNAIFVSVGHGLSLRQAVEITAMLSQARIPEPVRQADLRGRDLLRQAAAKASTKK